MKLLILRPQPGADESAARARQAGLVPIVAPLFDVHAIAWTPPDPAAFDGLLLTSANAVRLGGPALDLYLDLPCYAVGPATARAARAAGFADIRVGPSDAAALTALAQGRLLHLCGRDHIALPDITQLPIYAADPSGGLPDGFETMLALLHSPRAARRFAALVGDAKAAVRIAALSPQVAAAAGDGWAGVAIAEAPRDEALLALAAKLCQRKPE